MAEYIERDKVLELVEPDARPFLAERIQSIPAADVRPVVRGKWEKNCDTALFWKCSECGCYIFWRKEEYLLRNDDEPNYCPNCGAEMKVGEA